MNIYHSIYRSKHLLRSILLTGLSVSILSVSAQFAPVVGAIGTTALAADSSIFVAWASGCTVQRGYRDIAIPDSGFASLGSNTNALHQADNRVVSLGDAGKATLTFEKPIIDGPGFDFAVFENGFDFGGPGMAFLELAFVEVSSDGQHFVRFPSISNVQDTIQMAMEAMDGSLLNNLAGKYTFGYGTPFDLFELKDSAALDIHHITHVRVVDVGGSIDPRYGSRDSRGSMINDPYPTNFASSGFDLDAVGVIHQQTSDISDIAPYAMFQIYPNPASDLIHVTLSGIASFHYEVNDMAGRSLMEGYSYSGSINIAALPAGVFEVKVFSGEGYVFSKLIVKQ